MPPLIIGPMIRKMRESNDKKNMPMAAADEARAEAPGLRVGAGAWKWPPVWPYDNNFFKRQVELDAKAKDNAGLNPMAQMMGGAAGAAGGNSSPFGALDGDGNKIAGDGEENKEEELFDSLKYWDEKKEVKTELDERVAEKITK